MDNKNKKRKSYKGTKYYLPNKELLAEIERCRPSGVISEKLGQMIITLCERLCTKGNLHGYSYVEDMCGDAIVACTAAVFKFNPARSNNPFAYLSSVAMNAIRATLNSERLSRDTRDKLILDAGLNPSHSYLDRCGAPDPTATAV